MKLSLSIQSNSKLPTPTRQTLKRWVLAALDNRVTRAGTKSAELTLRFVDTREGHRLNREFRGKDYATNVLTFVYENAQTPAADLPPSEKPRSGHVSGDIVICMPVVLKEAKAQKKHWRAHCAHLVVHGMLHLQGFDHENDSDAQKMESRETAVLAHLGYPDPYLITE